MPSVAWIESPIALKYCSLVSFWPRLMTSVSPSGQPPAASSAACGGLGIERAPLARAGLAAGHAAGDHPRVGGHLLAGEQGVDDALPVDRHRDRLAELDVLPRAFEVQREAEIGERRAGRST